MRRLLMFAFVALIVPRFVTAADPQKYALLIGITKYDHAEMNKPQLEFPEADAKALGEFLSSAGYQSDYLLGAAATQSAIRKKLAGLNRKGSSDGVVVVGIFGHGVEIETTGDDGKVVTEGCFCPFDTSVQIARNFQGKPVLGDNGQPLTEPDPGILVKLTELLTELNAAKASNRVVFADCCRIVPNKARGRSFGASFKVQDLPQNTVVLFGCSPNEQAFEHEDWGHGAFTKCLLEELQDLSVDGDVTTGVLGDRLKKKVPKLVAGISTRNHQTPKPFSTDSIDLQITKLTSKPAKPSSSLPPNSAEDTKVTSRSAFAGKKAGEGKELVKGVTFHWCPPGNFTMGEDSTKVDVTLSLGFWLCETEVTQVQWQSLMKTTPWKNELYVKEGPKFAATYISHDEAVGYCAKLTEQERAAGRLPRGWKYTLPTEAQWEYSCRAGSKSKYSFGDGETNLGEFAWYGENASLIKELYAHEVGLKKANDWGMKDMHGNVWEWCADWYQATLPGGRDPAVLSEGSDRVDRGGSWISTPSDCCSAFRFRLTPVLRDFSVGFRVAGVPSSE